MGAGRPLPTFQALFSYVGTARREGGGGGGCSSTGMGGGPDQALVRENCRDEMGLGGRVAVAGGRQKRAFCPQVAPGERPLCGLVIPAPVTTPHGQKGPLAPGVQLGRPVAAAWSHTGGGPGAAPSPGGSPGAAAWPGQSSPIPRVVVPGPRGSCGSDEGHGASLGLQVLPWGRPGLAVTPGKHFLYGRPLAHRSSEVSTEAGARSTGFINASCQAPPLILQPDSPMPQSPLL